MKCRKLKGQKEYKPGTFSPKDSQDCDRRTRPTEGDEHSAACHGGVWTRTRTWDRQCFTCALTPGHGSVFPGIHIAGSRRN